MRELIESRSVRISESGCWIWMASTMGNGYGDFRYGGRHLLAHRASYEAFIGIIPDGLHVLHRCDIRCCVNPHHLRLGTNTENIHDCCSKGRNARVPNHVVLAIRDAKAAGEKQSQISERFGISQAVVASITSGRTRRFAPGPLTPPKNNRMPEDAVQRAIELVNSGMSMRAAAMREGLKQPSLWRRIRCR